MKVLYVGDKSILLAGIIERLEKEEHEVYCLTNVQERKRNYRHYYIGEKEDVQTIFTSIQPQVVIFGGFGYMNAEWDTKQKDYFSLLAGVLDQCKAQLVSMFIFLSSTEVYGMNSDCLHEKESLFPQTRKGMWLSQAENMVQTYQKQYGLRTAVLRLSQIYGNEIDIDAQDYFGKLAKQVINGEEIREEYLQPIHVNDVADAVKRIIERGEGSVYNICSSFSIKKSIIAQEIVEKCGGKAACIVDEEQIKQIISNQKIKDEQEWVDFWKLEELLKESSVKFVKRKETEQRAKVTGKRSLLRNPIRKTVENMVVFAAFFVLYVLTLEHSLFSQVNWLLIYVILISLIYGTKQSAMAVVAASFGHLSVQKGNLLNVTNFYTYIENVQVIVEYIFVGIIIGYTVDMLRENLRTKNQEVEELKREYEELKDINERNILIKREYEKRILDTKNGIPKLYSIIQKIDILDVERILMEVLHVVEELMETDTVSVYKVTRNENYLRLIAALNENSLVEKRSWNLEKYPGVKEGIARNELYVGDIWKNEPAIVMPISIDNTCKAVIVIKEVAMETMSLYHINLLRTLLLLVSRSLESAFQYEEALRAKKYLPNTDILIPEEFQKAVELAKEKKQREVADFVLLKIQTTKDLVVEFEKISDSFRDTDVFGTDLKGNMFVLLGNVVKEDENIVRERLAKEGIIVEKVMDFDMEGTNEA